MKSYLPLIVVLLCMRASSLLAQQDKDVTAYVIYHDKLLPSLDDDKQTLRQLQSNGWLNEQETKAIKFKHTKSERKDLLIDKKQIDHLPVLILYTYRLGYWTFYDKPELVPGSNRKIDHRWGIPKRIELMELHR